MRNMLIEKRFKIISYLDNFGQNVVQIKNRKNGLLAIGFGLSDNEAFSNALIDLLCFMEPENFKFEILEKEKSDG